MLLLLVHMVVRPFTLLGQLLATVQLVFRETKLTVSLKYFAQ